MDMILADCPKNLVKFMNQNKLIMMVGLNFRYLPATLEKIKYPERLKRLLYLKKPASSLGITRPGAQGITEILQ